ncbi:MAG: hypothetical protein AAFU38_20805 [Bacteroidota bacterium]
MTDIVYTIYIGDDEEPLGFMVQGNVPEDHFRALVLEHIAESDDCGLQHASAAYEADVETAWVRVGKSEDDGFVLRFDNAEAGDDGASLVTRLYVLHDLPF